MAKKKSAATMASERLAKRFSGAGEGGTPTNKQLKRKPPRRR